MSSCDQYPNGICTSPPLQLFLGPCESLWCYASSWGLMQGLSSSGQHCYCHRRHLWDHQGAPQASVDLFSGLAASLWQCALQWTKTHMSSFWQCSVTLSTIKWVYHLQKKDPGHRLVSDKAVCMGCITEDHNLWLAKRLQHVIRDCFFCIQILLLPATFCEWDIGEINLLCVVHKSGA